MRFELDEEGGLVAFFEGFEPLYLGRQLRQCLADLADCRQQPVHDVVQVVGADAADLVHSRVDPHDVGSGGLGDVHSDSVPPGDSTVKV
jgi:hypothetical protein